MTQQTANQSQWTDEQIGTAKKIWAEYETTHDVSDRKGQTAGIDPETEAVWFGTDIIDIIDQRKEKGLSSPLYFVRIGYATYLRKGGRR